MRQYLPTALKEAFDEACLPTTLKRTTCLVAKSMVDVREEGINTGYFIDMVNMTVDGKAVGESYCCSTVQSVIAYIEYRFNVKSKLFASEHCMTMWRDTPKELRVTKPEIGDIIVWNWKGTDRGHTGIIVDITADGMLKVVEGNTRSGNLGFTQGNEGEGIYLKLRPQTNVGDMLLVGYLRPF